MICSGWTKGGKTYSSHLSEEFVAVFNCNHAFSVTEIVDGPCQEDDVSWTVSLVWDQPPMVI